MDVLTGVDLGTGIWLDWGFINTYCHHDTPLSPRYTIVSIAWSTLQAPCLHTNMYLAQLWALAKPWLCETGRPTVHPVLDIIPKRVGPTGTLKKPSNDRFACTSRTGTRGQTSTYCTWNCNNSWLQADLWFWLWIQGEVHRQVKITGFGFRYKGKLQVRHFDVGHYQAYQDGQLLMLLIYFVVCYDTIA